jgi:predicted HTH transcriptional regulator
MPKPKEVFDNPDAFWSFLIESSDDKFEGQHFDRKEAGLPAANGVLSKNHLHDLRHKITECVSAFANKNIEGGLLVIGIASDGTVKGTDHLTEQQRNDITNFDTYIINQAAEAKFHPCTDEKGAPNHILLIFVPHTDRAICEKPGKNQEGWTRNGSQNIPLTQITRDQLKQRKFIVEFENTYCCDFDIDDVDREILEVFRKYFLPDDARQFSDEELLREAGAIIKTERGYAFTKAGLLFFATNPQRELPGAYIRLMRFSATSDKMQQRGTPTFDQPFTGSITKQVRTIRTFLKESAFFKTYQVRNPDGGFTPEPEYPPIVIDEAIVNAVAHREYSIGLPIECEAYLDAFIVRNPGRMRQRDEDLPDVFSLENRTLNSTPHNPKLLRWLQIIRDPSGKTFVQAISEGTKRMAAEMKAYGLPAPVYCLSESQTELKLISNSEEREAKILADSSATESGTVTAAEFTNLYPLDIRQSRKPVENEAFRLRYKEFLSSLKDALIADGWYIDRFGFSRIIAHRRNSTLDLPRSAASIMRIYPAYEFAVREFSGHQYLCLDYTIQVLNVTSLNALLSDFPAKEFLGRRCVANKDGWQEGRIIEAEQEWATILLFQYGREVKVPSSSVIPYCSQSQLEILLHRKNVQFDLHQAIKKYALSGQTGASRARAEKIASMITYVSERVFPVRFGDFEVRLDRKPVQLTEYGKASRRTLPAYRLAEPAVEFKEHHASTDVRDGITRFGAYDDSPHTIELIPICLLKYRNNLEQLIERLMVGKYKYRGSERTFATRFTYQGIITVEHPEEVQNEVKRLISQHPDWAGNPSLNRIFLAHTPEQGYSVDDASSPYYVVKRLLLENGIPCQMVDTPTILNPDWKDLNLALNITAKCGVTPWVLPDAIPDADFFVGLSYTQSSDGKRIMGFANVFSNYGKWEFYSGDTSSFDYEERAKRFADLVRHILERLQLPPTPNIIFHYSAKFSQEDREAILKAAREIRSEGTYTFVWINTHHNVRIFDRRAETDGSLTRGTYVQTSPYQIFLSTTGYNPFRRAMGTPKPLQVNVHVCRPAGAPNAAPDMKSIAVQVLSLTKLNWASTDAFTGEPITTKYAGDIAYLTAAFLRQSESFNLHPTLVYTPWFL